MWLRSYRVGGKGLIQKGGVILTVSSVILMYVQSTQECGGIFQVFVYNPGNAGGRGYSRKLVRVLLHMKRAIDVCYYGVKNIYMYKRLFLTYYIVLWHICLFLLLLSRYLCLSVSHSFFSLSACLSVYLSLSLSISLYLFCIFVSLSNNANTIDTSRGMRLNDS